MSSNDTPIPSEAYFITPPQLVSWSKESTNSEVAAWGTNEPYLNYSSTKLRKLTLGDAMFEGFSDGKQVEGNVRSLEAAMKMVLNEDGYASPYCWTVFAGGKSYGTFIISSVQVKEEMRDMAGNATRAFVDVELTEVPSYQVSTGIDLTSPATGGRLASEREFATGEQAIANNEVVTQDTAVATTRANSPSAPPRPFDGGTTPVSNLVAYRNSQGQVIEAGSGTVLREGGGSSNGYFLSGGIIYGPDRNALGTI